MSTTFTLDTATSRAHPVPEPLRRLTVPGIAKRKGGEPIVMLTAYTARMAQLLDRHWRISGVRRPGAGGGRHAGHV